MGEGQGSAGGRVIRVSVIWACHWGGGLGCRETLIFLIYPPSLLLCAVSVLDMNMEIKP